MHLDVVTEYNTYDDFAGNWHNKVFKPKCPLSFSLISLSTDGERISVSRRWKTLPLSSLTDTNASSSAATLWPSQRQGQQALPCFGTVGGGPQGGPSELLKKGKKKHQMKLEESLVSLLVTMSGLAVAL